MLPEIERQCSAIVDPAKTIARMRSSRTHDDRECEARSDVGQRIRFGEPEVRDLRPGEDGVGNRARFAADRGVRVQDVVGDHPRLVVRDVLQFRRRADVAEGVEPGRGQYATLVCGLAKSTGEVELHNAGHCPAIVAGRDDVYRSR